jgi:hypothetical protein
VKNRETPLWDRSPISREGVTCITCHRVSEQYGKVNGERRVVPGKIYEPVYGSGEKSVIKDVLANKDTYSVKTSTDGRGNDIHKGMITNDQITKSEFCVSCHQVAVNLGIKLEIVWDQYRDSPARKANVTCQDCHMGKVPGKPEGYATAPLRRSRRQGGQSGAQARQSPLHRPWILDRAPRHLPAQHESAGLQHQGLAAVRLARRMGAPPSSKTRSPPAKPRSPFPSGGPMRSTARTRARSSRRTSRSSTSGTKSASR